MDKNQNPEHTQSTERQTASGPIKRKRGRKPKILKAPDNNQSKLDELLKLQNKPKEEENTIDIPKNADVPQVIEKPAADKPKKKGRKKKTADQDKGAQNNETCKQKKAIKKKSQQGSQIRPKKAKGQMRKNGGPKASIEVGDKDIEHKIHQLINKPGYFIDLCETPDDEVKTLALAVSRQFLAKDHVKFDPNILQIQPKKRSSRRSQNTENRVYAFGSAKFDQFSVDENVFESKRPLEIPFFAQNNIRIVKIACGAQHTALLDQEGKVYTWGNAKEGCLGRAVRDKPTTPGIVELDEPVNLISSGENHTICANSTTGSYFFWGTLRTTTHKTIISSDLPKKTPDSNIKRQGITDIKSGNNHIVMLVGSRVYALGDNDNGALGTIFRKGRAITSLFEPRKLDIPNVSRIYTGGNHTFIVDRSDRVYACGLNNYGQLGLGSDIKLNKAILPTEIPKLSGKWVKDIKGGEHHTLILMNNGWVFGAGINDHSQLGKLQESIKVAGFTKIACRPIINKIMTSSHFNYAEDIDKRQYYSWGAGNSYVLATGKEDSSEKLYPISNDYFFNGNYPTCLDLGRSHVVYTINKLGNKRKLLESMQKHKKEYKRSNTVKQTKKVPMSNNN